jgi:epoxyqueuosine reductase
MPDPSAAAFEPIAEQCRRLGLTPCGVVAARRDPETEERYRRWLAAGRHGSMAYLERHAPFKANPEALLPGCRSVLMVALGYYQTPERGWIRPDSAARLSADEAGPATGRVAQYAWGRDYHKLLGKRLRSLVRVLAEQYPDEQFRTGVDATPLLEAHHAVAAGVGFRGKHTLAINGEHGSWFFIGEVLTTLTIAPNAPAAPTARGAHKRCGSECSFCIDVCPTRAIVAPYQLDARRCISYLTIEHRGPVAEELRPAIGEWLFGCDLCQEVCPWTVRAGATTEPDLLNWRAGDALELAALLELRSHDDMVARFAGSPLMRAGRDRLVRNACTVAGNRGAVELLPQLRRLTSDRDRGVAEHARWAVARINGTARAPVAGS